jgi:8-oxo-dGTP diphosphatase
LLPLCRFGAGSDVLIGQGAWSTMTAAIDKLAWIHIVNRRILSTRSRGKATYYLPGGKREGGETDREALIREIREELSVELSPETIRYVGTFEAQAHGQAEGVVVRMTCYSGDHIGELKPAAEIEEMVWFIHKDRERSSPVDKIIFDWLQEQNLID